MPRHPDNMPMDKENHRKCIYFFFKLVYMISKARIKFIKSLQLKKYRKQEQSFVVEGEKNVRELLDSDYVVTQVICTEDFKNTYYSKANKKIDWVLANDRELNSIGSFKTNQSALAVADMKTIRKPSPKSDEWVLVLDDIRDPGNLGTIIRTADWFGLTDIVVSAETTDVYNPKVLHASMGSFCRVNIYPTELSTYLSAVSGKVYGTYLKGEDIHSLIKPEPGHLVIGNESVGISAPLEKFITDKITIQKLGGAESLNAAMATGIILDNLIRLQK